VGAVGGAVGGAISTVVSQLVGFTEEFIFAELPTSALD
jgi:hypothetical protein